MLAADCGQQRRKQEYEAEEAKAVQRRNGALRIDGVHVLSLGKI